MTDSKINITLLLGNGALKAEKGNILVCFQLLDYLLKFNVNPQFWKVFLNMIARVQVSTVSSEYSC